MNNNNNDRICEHILLADNERNESGLSSQHLSYSCNI